MTDAAGNEVENEYRSEYVVQDEVVMVSTSGQQSVMLENSVRRGDECQSRKPGDGTGIW